VILDPSNAVGPDGQVCYRTTIVEQDSSRQLLAGPLPASAQMVKALGTLPGCALSALARIQDEMERERFDTTHADLIRALARDNQRFHALVVRSARSAPLDRCFVQFFQLPLPYKTYV